MGEVRFRVFGGIGVFVDGVERRLRPMERFLLAIFLSDHNRVIGAERLADLLWRGSPPRSERVAVRVHVDRLRRAVQSGDVSRIVFTGGGYRLAVEPHELDITRFEAALSRGQAARAEHPDAAATLFREALAEWRGIPFDLVEDIPAVDAARAALQRRHSELVSGLIQVEFVCGRYADLIPELERWTAADPLSEPLSIAFVTALHRTGDQVGALAHCRAFRKTLRSELGLDPSKEFAQLHNDVLNRTPPPTASIVARTGAVFTAVPGRSSEVDAVLRRLSEGVAEPGVIVLCGPRGVGTSAVLAEVHRQVPGSVAVRCEPGVPLAALTRLEKALGVPETAETDADLRAHQLAHRIQQVQVPALLIDDTHAMDADEAEVFRRLRSILAARVPVVTACRELSPSGNPLLRDTAVLAGATTIQLAPLSGGAARAVVASILRADQVENEDVVASIVDLADGDAYLLTGLARHVLAGGDLTSRPASVTEFVRRLVGELVPDARTMLAVAAVIGAERLDLAFIGEVAETTKSAVVEAAENALAIGILRDAHHGLEFRHRYFREVLTDELSAIRRADVHGRVADLLIAAGSDDAARIAAHLRAAATSGRVELAANWTVREARRLLAAGAPMAAAHSASVGRSLLVDSGQSMSEFELRATLIESEARAMAGDVRASQLLALAAAAQARQLRLVEQFADAAILSVGPFLPAGEERSQAAVLTGEGLDVLKSDDGTRRIALVEAWVRSHVLADDCPSADVERAAEELRNAIAAAPEESRCLALRGQYNLSWRLDHGAAQRLPVGVALAVSAARAGRWMLRLEGLRMQVCDHLEAADLAGMTTALEAYRRQADDVGAPLHQWWSAQLGATLAELRSDELSAQAWLLQANEHARWVDPQIVLASRLERSFCAAVRADSFVELLESMAPMDLDDLATDALVELLSAFVAVHLSVDGDADELRRGWRQFVHGPYAVPTSALAALALRSIPRGPAVDAFARELHAVLLRAGGGFCYLNGAGFLGPVDGYLAHVYEALGDGNQALQHEVAARQLTESFALPRTDRPRKLEARA